MRRRALRQRRRGTVDPWERLERSPSSTSSGGPSTWRRRQRWKGSREWGRGQRRRRRWRRWLEWRRRRRRRRRRWVVGPPRCRLVGVVRAIHPLVLHLSPESRSVKRVVSWRCGCTRRHRRLIINMRDRLDPLAPSARDASDDDHEGDDEEDGAEARADDNQCEACVLLPRDSNGARTIRRRVGRGGGGGGGGGWRRGRCGG